MHARRVLTERCHYPVCPGTPNTKHHPPSCSVEALALCQPRGQTQLRWSLGSRERQSQPASRPCQATAVCRQNIDIFAMLRRWPARQPSPTPYTDRFIVATDQCADNLRAGVIALSITSQSPPLLHHLHVHQTMDPWIITVYSIQYTRGPWSDLPAQLIETSQRWRKTKKVWTLAI